MADRGLRFGALVDDAAGLALTAFDAAGIGNGDPGADAEQALDATTELGGAIMYWHVDDLNATFERLLSMGAKEYQPITPRGTAGFVTAAVVDPFGNVLGVMYNPHYLEVLATKPA